jgi:hypothetical protein
VCATPRDALVDFVAVPGQAHELAPSLQLLKRLADTPDWVLTDMACDAREFRTTLDWFKSSR